MQLLHSWSLKNGSHPNIEWQYSNAYSYCISFTYTNQSAGLTISSFNTPDWIDFVRELVRIAPVVKKIREIGVTQLKFCAIRARIEKMTKNDFGEPLWLAPKIRVACRQRRSPG
jgi:hypothetical protein